MNPKTQQTSRTLLAVMLLYTVVSLINLGSWGVVESSEARYAEITREMIASNDWIHPTLLGIHHYHKPPVTYWLTAIGYSIFGINPFGARFLLVVCYVAQIYFVYRIAMAIVKDEKISLYAAIVYSSFPIVIISVRGLTADAYLNTLVLVAIASWLKWRASLKVPWLFLTSILLGLAFLTKGPVALLIPVLVFLGLDRSVDYPHVAFKSHHLLALLIFLIVGGSWFAILVDENKSFVDYFLFRHTIDRFNNASIFSRTEPWWYYLAYAPLIALPWTILLFYQFRSTKKNQIPTSIKKIAVFWVLLPLIFFSFSSSKLLLYVLPVFSGLAIVCAWCLQAMRPNSIRSLERILFFWAIMICIILLAISIVLSYEISAGMIALSLIYLFIVIYMRIRSTFKGKQKVLLYSLSLSCYLILFSSLFMPLNGLRVNSTQPMADWIIKNGLKNHQVIVYDQLLPSLSFALQKDIISVSNGNRNLNREVQFEENDRWKNLLINLKDDKTICLDSLLSQPSVIIAKANAKNIRVVLGRGPLMKKEFDKWVVYYSD